MKRIKRNAFLGCMLLAVITISACSKTDNTDIESKTVTTIEEIQESTIAEGDGSFPSENQMAKDIDSFGANVISLENGEYTLETKSIKIDKAKKETEQYLVYCTATQESDMFKANNSYVMIYNYYDIGGWVLDECYVENVDMTPKTSIPEEEARDYADGGNNFTSLDYSETEKVSDVQYIFHYVGKYEYTYMDDIYNIDVTCTYDNEYGWSIFSEEVSSYHDWSKMCGTWSGEDTENSGWKYKIVIKEVDEVAGEIKCDVTLAYPQSDAYKEMLGKDRKLVKKNLTAKILDEIVWFLEDKYLAEKERLEYNAEIKDLHSYTSFMDATASLALCWGKDVGMSKVIFDDGMGGEYFTYLNKEK